MFVVKPVPITDSILTVTNVAENDHPVWSAGTYAADDRVIRNHRIYKALSSTSDVPETGAVADPPTWLDEGATNLYSAFDNIIERACSNANTIEFAFEATSLVNAVFLFNCQCSTVQVTVTDATDGVVYDKTVNMVDNSGITTPHEYYFSPIEAKTKAAFVDLPYYAGAEVSVTLDAGSGTASVGEVVIGQRRTIGDFLFNSEVGIDDYSVKERDPNFGGAVLREGSFSDAATYPVSILTKKVDSVVNYLKPLRATPLVFVGTVRRETTIVFGWFEKLRVVTQGAVYSDCSLKVEGLV